MKKIYRWIICLTFLIAFNSFPITAKADMGPKPSVTVIFSGLEDENYYVTLLSESDSTGPWSHGNDYYEFLGEESVFWKFSDYEDSDGYYFLSFMEECSEDDTFEWGYYPPKNFKILIYFPEREQFYCSEEIYERYAFDSYYTVNISELENTEASATITAQKSYDYSMEIVSLIARIVLTIGVEILIALLFGYRDKKSLGIIGITNVLTQIVLNVLLNVINYQSGQYAFVFHYMWMEIVVFAIEAVIYSKFMDAKTDKRRHPVRYAAVANFLSIAAGLWIAKTIPGIF